MRTKFVYEVLVTNDFYFLSGVKDIEKNMKKFYILVGTVVRWI